MRTVLRAVIAAALLTSPAADQTDPSFDCTQALHGVERVICFDPDLSVLDRELAAVYRAAQSGPDMTPRAKPN